MWNELIIFPFTNVLLWIYNAIGHNFGIAIILFTILIRAITWPLNAQQLKSAKVMQDLQKDKEWQDIQKKYAKDREKLAQETMRIYKERGINPFASCLPTLIQIPIIFGLYQSIMRAMAASPGQLLILSRVVSPILSTLFHINNAVLVPLNSKFLWMNLGQPERVYLFGIGVPVLAIIVAITTYIQSKVTLPPSTGSNDQMGMTNNMMVITMPLMLGYFALTFASGLSVYFIAGNLVGIAQYALLGKVNWKALLPGKQPVPQKQAVARKSK